MFDIDIARFSLVVIGILGISLYLAARSMQDLRIHHEIARKLRDDSIKGTIVFLKDKIIHVGKGKG